MNYYFTSDFHFGHKNIIGYAMRPFDDVVQMDETIITNFNSIVLPHDIVYYLGDFCFHSDFDNYFSRLNGQWHFVLGNHDKKIKQRDRILSINNLADIEIQDQCITLCHYPMATWNKSHFNSWQLYGHHHWDTNEKYPGKRMNVCVDVWDYQPVSFEYIKTFMESRSNNEDYIEKEDRRWKT